MTPNFICKCTHPKSAHTTSKGGCAKILWTTEKEICVCKCKGFEVDALHITERENQLFQLCEHILESYKVLCSAYYRGQPDGYEAMKRRLNYFDHTYYGNEKEAPK